MNRALKAAEYFYYGFAFYFSKAFLCLAEKGVTGSER